MKKKYKNFLLCSMVSAMTFTSSLVSFAGQQKQDHIGWWWQEDNGSYPVSTWQWIDGNNDGIAECYYFDNLGYCLLNTITPDGYTVNADGAWIVNGIIQTKSVAIHNSRNSNTNSESNEAPSDWETPEVDNPTNDGPLPGETTIDIFANAEAAGDGGKLITDYTVNP